MKLPAHTASIFVLSALSLPAFLSCLQPGARAQGLEKSAIPPDVIISSPDAQNKNQAKPGVQGKEGGVRSGQGGMGPESPTQGQKDPLAVMVTDKGTIVMRLFRKLAPNTVANFVELSQKGFYNGLTFHRVEPGFVIQGGDPNGDGTGMYIDPQTHKPRTLRLEISPRLHHNAAGVVAMAHAQSPDSGSCQFYITLAPEPALDYKYSIFAGVIKGMDVVRTMAIGDKIQSVTIQEQN